MAAAVLIVAFVCIHPCGLSKEPPKKRDADTNKFVWQELEVYNDTYENKELDAENKAEVEKMKEEGKILNYCRCNYCQGSGQRVFYKVENKIDVKVKVECPYCKGLGYKVVRVKRK